MCWFFNISNNYGSVVFNEYCFPIDLEQIYSISSEIQMYFL